MRMRVCIAVVVAVAGLLPMSAAQAVAPVRCGAVLTASTSLARNLTCASGVGLTLKGNITLDLRGHRLIGPGKSAPAFAASLGIALSESGTPRVQNGTIQGWGIGTGPSDDNGGLSAAVISHVTYADDGSGLSGVGSTFTVADSRFLRNADKGITGLSTFATVRRSLFMYNGRAINLSDGGAVTLSWSIVAHNEIGVSCQEVGCTLTYNSLRYNTTAVAAFFARGKISRNDIRGNHIGFTTTFDPDPGYAHELSENLIRDNASGVLVSDLGTAYVHDNMFVGNGVGFGVPATGPAPTALLARNLFVRNHDGVLARAAGTSLKGNRAVANLRWGIYAVGAKDLGGNVAYRNGQRQQCAGVVCANHR
jgi:copper-binding protein NosD